MSTRRRRGVALLISIAVLSVLSVLGITFVRTMTIERYSASNYALSVRAQFMAQAGVARAIADLQERAGSASVGPNETWMFRDDSGGAIEFEEHADLESAKFPSFAFDKDGDGVFENGVGGTSTSDLVNGRAVSGVVAGVSVSGAGSAHFGQPTLLDDEGHVYVLRVRDTAGKINLNGPQASLAATLDHLGKAIAKHVELYDPIDGRGKKIVDLRDAQSSGRFASLDDLVGLLTATEVDDLRGYLTCHSWRDDTTILPEPSSDPAYLPGLAVEARHPVNVNTAAKVVLIALLRDLAGYARVTGATVDSKSASTPISESQAEAIADALVSARKTSPFRTYTQLASGFASAKAAAGLTDDQLAVLMAAFDPHPRLNQINADGVRQVSAAKADLTRHSTELCFGPNGYFEIESLGLVTTRKGQIIARAEELLIVRLMDIVRHATQADFTSAHVDSANTTTHPNLTLDTSPSTVDGQVAMFVPPPDVPSFRLTNFCFTVTSDGVSLPTNHIATHVPPEHAASVMASVENDRGWLTVEAKHEPKTGMEGFKFSPGTLGGKGKIESVSYCFSIPKDVLTEVKIATKAGSPADIVSFDVTTPGAVGTSATTENGFTITFDGLHHHTEDGETSKGLPDWFLATYAKSLDADFASKPKAATTRIQGVSVLKGSSLMADGVLTRRWTPELLAYEANANMPLDEGTIELWVKLGADGMAGTTEPIFNAVNPIVTTTDQALVTQIVRSGSSLLATRAYAGSPSAAASPYPYSLVESTASIADWRAGEWHHLSLVWFDGVDHRFYVDGVEIESKLASITPLALSGDDLGDRMAIGGVTYDGSTKSFSTSTIAEVKIFSAQEHAPGGFTAPERFVADGPSTSSYWHGKLAIALAAGARIKAIAWTERRPGGYAATSYTDLTTAPDVEVSYRLVGASSWIDVPKADLEGGDGRGVAVDLPVAAYGGTGTLPGLEYKLRFTGSVVPLNTTAAIDDVRVIVVSTPRVLWRRTG